MPYVKRRRPIGSRKRPPGGSKRFVRRGRRTARSGRVGNLSGYKLSFPLSARSQKMVFRYVEQGSIDCAAGAATGAFFKANGMFDPRDAIGGHQPYGFDNMMAFYNHYTVIGSKIKYTVCNNQAASPFKMALSIRPDTTGIPTDAGQLLEQPGIKSKLLAPLGSGSAQGTLTMSFSAKKYFGAKYQVGHDLYRGNAAADPTEVAHFVVIIIPQTTDDLVNNQVWIEITYIAVLTEPKFLAQS